MQTRETWTLYVSDTRPGPDYKGEKITFECRRDALTRMWAEAKRENPRTVWLSAGLDGWDTNHHMKSQKCPNNLELGASIRAEIERLNALEFNERNDRPITINLERSPSGGWTIYCPEARYDITVHEHRLGETISHLYYEYQSICEAGL